MRDDLWADRLCEEIDGLGRGGVVVIDDLRWPGEYLKLRERDCFTIRLVTAYPATPDPWLRSDDPREAVDGLLSHAEFDAVVPAKGLVPQEVLEGLISNLWREKIEARVTAGG